MQEIVLIEGMANQVKGMFVGNGHGTLTNKRFIYSKQSLAKTITMGVFVNLTKGSSYEYDIPMEEIESMEVGKVRLFTGLIITKKDGEVFRYAIAKPTDWRIAIGNFLNTDDKTDTKSTEEPSEKNFCSSCGAKINEGSKFCHNCGAQI